MNNTHPFIHGSIPSPIISWPGGAIKLEQSCLARAQGIGGEAWQGATAAVSFKNDLFLEPKSQYS
jgi:hypothetical protein